MRIANPIYDSVFKHLMENLEIARGLIARLLGVEILDLTPQPHEVTERQAAGVGDAQALMRVYRIDFSATMKLADGREHRVLIELQKASKCEAVSRFRNYLARHYAVPATAKSPLPIVAIYLLGFELSANLPKVTRVKRQYLHGVSGEVLAENRVTFIEQLTHDAVVVQIPSIDESSETELERLLQIFNQHYLDSENPHYLRVPQYLEQNDDPLVRSALRTLLMAGADEETVRQMEVEDEIVGVLDELDVAKQEAVEERRLKEEALRKQEEERQQKEEALEKIRELEARLAGIQGPG